MMAGQAANFELFKHVCRDQPRVADRLLWLHESKSSVRTS